MIGSIITYIKKHATFIKLMFVVTVGVLVTAQLLSILKSISPETLKTIFETIPFWQLLVIVLIGLISILPMIAYDFILKRMLSLDFSNRYIFETSWIINTINNLAGFGGLVSIGLRNEFYSKGTKSKKILGALTKILLFVLSGLSIYSLLFFVLVEFFSISEYVRQYWIWLLGGGLYFPLLYILAKRKKNGLLSGLSFHRRWGLIGASFLEWTGMILTFSTIGYFLQSPIPLADAIPLFIAATVIGIVSMIPGGLGSFDVMIILGFSSFGLEKETAVLWLLLYRIAYYILPFLLGLTLFSKHLFTKINDKYNDLPKQISIEVFHKIIVYLLYFSGIIMVLVATLPYAFTSNKWLIFLNPYRLHIIDQFPSLLFGFLLLMMGRGMAARVKRAFYPTIIILSLTIFYALFADFSPLTIFSLVFTLLLVLMAKSELYREQLVYAWEWMTVDGIIYGFLTLTYLIIGVYNFPSFTNHFLKHRHHKFVSFFLFPSEKIWFIGFIAIMLVILFLTIFTRYLKGSKKKVGHIVHKEVLDTILQTYGGNIDSELVFLNDKEIYLYPKENPTVFLQFKTINNKCIVMGNPSGNKEDFEDSIQSFITDCDQLGYVPVFYEVNEKIVLTMHEYGYDFIKMGEEALVDLSTFSIAGKKQRGTRALMNKFTKEGYEFGVLTPPFSQEILSELRCISDSWLDGRKEKGFSLGYFDKNYLQRNPIAVVKNTNGKIVSFANIIPAYSDNSATIDLMRHHKTLAPSGSMDFLFVNLFQHLNNQSIKYFNMGMAPLANVGQYRSSFFQERLASLIYEFGSQLYSFQGLREYKAKFATIWNPRYTLYSRDSWLLYVIIALLIVDNKTTEE